MHYTYVLMFFVVANSQPGNARTQRNFTLLHELASRGPPPISAAEDESSKLKNEGGDNGQKNESDNGSENVEARRSAWQNLVEGARMPGVWSMCCLSIYLSAYLFIYLSAYLSICLSVYLSTRAYVLLST